MSFFSQMGPFEAPMLVLAAVVVGLAVWRAAQIFGRVTPADPAVATGINSVLFWGVVSSLVGFLGFFSGVYTSLRAVGHLDSVSPRIVALGVAESLTSTIFGLVILLLATIAWFLLHAGHARLTRGGDDASREPGQRAQAAA